MGRRGVFCQLIYHFVWSTKHRHPLITPDVESHLYPFLVDKCKELNYDLLALGGIEDHMHLLMELHPTQVVADVPKMLKGSSSHFLNHVVGLSNPFYWQDGYAVITLRKDEVNKVIAYIRNQKAHHGSGVLSNTLEQLSE